MTNSQNEKLISLFHRQEELNCIINPNWKTDRTAKDFHMATFVECGELIDHLDYKWWKSGKIDVNQAKIEVADIWFFMLSFIILKLDALDDEEYKQTVDTLSTNMNDWLLSRKPTQHITLDDVFGEIDNLILDASDDFSPIQELCSYILISLCKLTYSMNMSFDNLYDIYMGKLILNVFRQKNGYSDGTYIKTWNGIEDNEVLHKIMMKTSDLEEIDRLLENGYKLI